MTDKADEKPTKKKVADPAVKCLAACDEALAQLDDAAQGRVMAWLSDKYRPVPPPAGPKE